MMSLLINASYHMLKVIDYSKLSDIREVWYWSVFLVLLLLLHHLRLCYENDQVQKMFQNFTPETLEIHFYRNFINKFPHIY